MIRSRCQSLLFIAIGLVFCALPVFGAGTTNSTGSELPLPVVGDESPRLDLHSAGRALGDTVFIEGSGFASNETVSILVVHQNQSGSNVELAQFDVQATADGAIEALWVVEDESHAWLPIIVSATGSNAETSAPLTEIDSRLAIISMPDTIMTEVSYEVTVLLEQDCCDGVYAPMPDRLIEFHIHQEECGIPIEGDPIATAVTDENGVATATLTATEVGLFTIGVKYAGEDQPGPDDPPNSVCYPDDRVKILASIDCTRFDIIWDPVDIECSTGQFFVCSGETVCLPTTVVYDGAGDLLFTIPDGLPCTIDAVTGELCLTPDTAGTYYIDVTATDSIGQTDQCTATFEITMNSDPTVDLPPDMTVYPCYPKEVCVPVELADPDGNIADIIPSLGVYSEGQVCVTIDQPGDYDLIIEVTDSCGVTATDTMRITADPGPTVFVDLGPDFDRFLCEPAEICIDVATIDAFANLTTSLGIYNADAGQVCFTPEIAGVYDMIVEVTDTCGFSASDTVAVLVRLNTAPHVRLPQDATVQPCYPRDICIPFDTMDVDGNIESVVSNVGIVDGPYVCLTIHEPGVSEIILTVTDACGETALDIILITAEPGEDPWVTLPADMDTLLCGGETICVDVTTISGYGSLTTNLGTYDEQTGQVCFTPEGDGLYSLIVEVTDTCGNAASDTINIDVSMNRAPTISAVSDTSFYLCFPQAICLPVDIGDADQNIVEITTNQGYYDNGLVCFTPYAAGSYEIVVTATDECGESASTTINLTIMTDQDIAIECPNDTTLSVCVQDTICLPLNGIPQSDDITVDVLGLNTWYDDATHSVCFYTECSNQNNIQIMVHTPCSTYTCEFTVTVECNVDPLVLLPPDTTMFLCAPGDICLPVGISDVNNNIVNIQVDGGSYDASTGQVCFAADTAGTYQIVVTALDDCGGEDADEILVRVLFNEAPVCNVPNDTSIFVCHDTQVMLPISATDADGNLVGCEVLSGPGTIVDGNWLHTPTIDETVTVTVVCTDECGVMCEASFAVTFDINEAPVVTCADYFEPIFVCNINDELCIDGLGVVDPDDNLASVTVTINGEIYPLVDGIVCFVPIEGTNLITLTAIDECGAVSTCETSVDVIVNSAPVCEGPNDTTLFLCNLIEICLPLTASDGDGNFDRWELISGPGYLNGDQWCYGGDKAEQLTVTVRALDSCGAYCDQTFTVTLEMNQSPTVVCPDFPDPVFVCDLSEICLDGFLVSDPDGNLDEVVVTVNGIIGTLNQGQICFAPLAGENLITVSAIDSCGAVSDCQTVVYVALNNLPTCNVPNDTTIFLCDLTEVSLPVSGDDIDGNLTGCSIISGPGQLVNGLWTYTPSGEETLTVTIQCTDDCGASCESSFTVTFDLNAPPAVACVDLLEPVFVCNLVDEICVDGFGAIDEDGNLDTMWVTVDGNDYPVIENSVCFVPVEGANSMILYAVDDCGDTSWCDAVVEVILNSEPVCLMPTDTTLFNCGPQELCLDLLADDPDGNLYGWQLISGPGTINGDQWCYAPEGTETVTVTARATDSCGAYCDQTFTVTFEINQPPVVTCPGDTTLWTCPMTDVCIGGFAATDPESALESIIVTVNGAPVNMTDGIVCFTPIEGPNVIVLTALDACGAESSCETIVTFDLNDPPICNPPNDTTIVLCEPEEICLPVSATDANGNLDRCEVQSGVGDIIDGYWCFTPNKSVGGTITVRCFDSCGAYCDAEFTVTIELNAPPVVYDRFTSATLCDPDQLREVGVAAYDPDGDPMTFIMLSGVGTVDTQTGYISYYPDTSGVYTFEVGVYDTCAGDTGFVYDTITINTPPELITFDSTIYLCNIQEICFDVVATDADGDILNITQESGPGGFTMLTDSSGQTCFMPDDVDSATYMFEYCVTDPCTGSKIYSDACPECPPCDPDTIRITVLLDRPSVVECPEPQLFSICEPQTLCFDFDPGDPGLTVNILSQNAIYDAGSVCFDAVGNDQFDIVIEVVDNCDHADTCIVPVTIEGNHAPSVTTADDSATFLCEPTEICFDVAVTDADMDVLTVTVNNGVYNSDAQQVCFNADTAGSYMIIVTAADSCGATASDTTVVTVDLNEPPYVDLGADFEVGLCGLAEVCVDITVGDDDGNLLTVTPSLGSYDPQTGKVCFEVDHDGTYELIVEATDECGATAADTVTITVTSGAPPFVDLGDDLDLGLCEMIEICVDVNTIDVYQSLITNLGIYNEATSQICFTPDGPGEYTMIVTVVDSCDLSATDTVVINISGNSPPVATGMPDTTVYLCYPQAICLPIDISDPDDNIQSIDVNRGSYSNGQVCFTPYDSGTFEIIVTVTDSCDMVDADTAYVTILTDQGIELVCPNDTTIFTCVGDTFCLPIGGIPEIATVNVTGINTWFDDELQSVCFLSECGNTNQVTLEVVTPCGDYSCSFTVTIECNHDPLVLMPPDSSIMFCGPSEVCVPVGVYDPDGNIAEVIVEGGLYDSLHSRVCFTADTAGVYNLIVTAVDECDEEDSDTMAVTIEFNTAPFIIYDWADSVITTCQPNICVPIAFGDAEDNLVEVLTDVGYYDDATGEICFTAESSGLYCVEVIAIDECGLADTLDACVTVDIGEFVQINCPEDTLQAEPICGPTEVCVPLEIIGNNFTVIPSIGTYAEGQLCIPADTAGIYVITVIGSAECNDDTCVVYVEVTIPDEAVITCPTDTAFLACGPDTICLDYTVSGSVEMISVTEPAYLNENQVCVPVLEAGSLEITMIATSICNSDTCSFTVTADFNSPPEIVSGPDTSLTVCEPYEVCIPITYSDVDDNIIEVSTSHGQIVEDKVCFTPVDFGIHHVVVSVRDACGETAYDTTVVTILPGGSPLIICPPTTVYDTLCAADSICITMPISPGDAVVTVLPNGSYDPATGEVCVYISETGLYNITVTAEAQCGVDTCEFDLDVQVPQPPVVTCPGVIDTLLCLTNPVELCYPVTVTGTALEITVEPEGSYADGEVCVTIDQPGSYDVTLIAAGRCEADTCVTTINVTGDQAPQLFLPEETPVFERCIDDTTLICIDGIYATDLEDGVTLTQTCGPGEFELITDDSGRVCFLPDAFGLYEFCFEVDDGCNITAGSFFVDIQELEDCDVCLRVSIDGGSCTPVGLLKSVDLNIETREWLGGFDILLAYDASVMAFTFAGIEGTSVDGWEYFEYRIGAADCGSSCPSGLIRLVGIADINNGPNHPPHETLFPNGVLVEMQFQVANDQNLGDQFLPINFAWYSCADNAFSDTSGADLFVDVRILNFEGAMIWDENDDVNYPESSRPFGLGTRDDCFGGGKVDPIRCVEFINGGICVTHPDSLDDRGDVNLNGVPYEIADAVVFSNYFIKGLSVFVVNVAGQIAATDVNADGVTLSVADLVLLIRVIIGDADPIPKLSPYPEELLVTTEYSDGRLSVSTDAVGEIGAALFVFDVNDATTIDKPQLATAAEGMDLMYAVVDGELRILIWDLGTDLVEVGEHRLIEIPYSGDAAPILKRREIVDYQGRPYRCVNKGGELPTEFSLSQNYPNPFNPATSISFSTPQASNWTLHIYNVTGKLVRSFSGHAPAGNQTITWDGLDSRGGTAASGVYFYRLDAGSFTDTKKMVLLK